MVNKLCQMLPRMRQEGKHPLSSRTEQSSRHIWQQILCIHFQKLRFLLVSVSSLLREAGLPPRVGSAVCRHT